MDYRPIVDVIGDVMVEVQKRFDPQTLPAVSEKPYYMFGHLGEMVNTLLEKSSNSNWKAKMFPCIMLVQDFDETVSETITEATLRVIIAHRTKPDIKAKDRYSLTFRPVLYPIMELFIDELKNNREINMLDVELNKTDRLYWGTTDVFQNKENIANDYIDAIEITNLKINILKNC